MARFSTARDSTSHHTRASPSPAMTLVPGAPALSSGMINPGDILLTVDGKRVKTRQDATKSILGEFGSSISLQMERDGKSFVVALLRAGVTHQS